MTTVLLLRLPSAQANHDHDAEAPLLTAPVSVLCPRDRALLPDALLMQHVARIIALVLLLLGAVVAALWR